MPDPMGLDTKTREKAIKGDNNRRREAEAKMSR
jgi:hypothetical protein